MQVVTKLLYIGAMISVIFSLGRGGSVLELLSRGQEVVSTSPEAVLRNNLRLRPQFQLIVKFYLIDYCVRIR
jgi:hypothetical protein